MTNEEKVRTPRCYAGSKAIGKYRIGYCPTCGWEGTEQFLYSPSAVKDVERNHLGYEDEDGEETRREQLRALQKFDEGSGSGMILS